MKAVRTILIICCFTLLGVPLLYYAYKHGTPEFGGLDVYSYYRLYSNWDFASVDSPFNQRLISSWCIYVLHLSGVNYVTETEVAKSGMDPQVYFSALLFNFMCVVMTCWVVYRIIRKYVSRDFLFSFSGGLLFLLGFGTLIFLITALSDSLSVLMIAGILYFYLGKSKWQYLLLALAIIQREYIFMIFGLIAFIEWLSKKEDRKYYLTVLAVNVLCFAGYIVCRKTIFFTPRYQHQMEVGGFIENITHSLHDAGAYIRQTLLLQNILALYFSIVLYKYFRKLSFNRTHVIIVFALLAEIIGLSFLIGLGNNTGRYFYMTTPIIIYFIAYEAAPLILKSGFTTNPNDTRLV